jgi:hypothetical protein
MSTPEEVAAEIQAETSERPDFLLDRFKTPEDQARAYAEAEKEMNRLRAQAEQDRAEFAAALEQMTELQAQQQPQQPGLDPQTNQLLASYQQAVDNGDAAAQLAITMALQQQMLDQKLEERFQKLGPQLDDGRQADRDIAFRIAEDRVQRQFTDEQWNEIHPDVQRWLNEHQGYLPQTNDPVAFETVITEAARTVVNEKAAERLAALEADRAAKLAAQSASGTGQGRFPTDTDEKKQEWQAVVDAPVASYSQLRSGR